MHDEHPAKRSHVVSTAAAFLLGLSLVAWPAAAQDEEPPDHTAPPPAPFMAVEDGDALYHATVSLDGLQEPWLHLANADDQLSLDLQILTVSLSTDARRSLVMQLEPGARQRLDLTGKTPFDEVTVVAKGAFEGHVSDASARADRARKLAVVPPVAETETALPTKGYGILCSGHWTLTCISPSTCTYVSPAIPGYVYGYPNQFDPHDVYWNLHTPTGNWTTSANGCWTVWSPSPWDPDCPRRVRNCYGEIYTISGTVSQP